MQSIKYWAFIVGLQFFFIQSVYSARQIVIGTTPLERNENITYFPQNINKVPEVLISRDQYLLSYNRKKRLLNWAAWKIEASDLGHIGRTNNFAIDQDLENYLSPFSEHAVLPTDYLDSCFDRGHQVPSADRDDSVENNEKTFLMSNMIPQTAYLNRELWVDLEQYTRDLVLYHNKKIYIIAGPIFDQNFGFIGANKDIPVPSKNFKIIIVLNHNQSTKDINSKTEIIPVIMPNILRSGKKPLDDKEELCTYRRLDYSATAHPNWRQFKTSLKKIEKLSGFKMTAFNEQD